MRIVLLLLVLLGACTHHRSTSFVPEGQDSDLLQYEVRNASSCPMRVVMQRLKTADKAAPVADLAYLPANASDVIEVRQDQLKTGHIWWKWADERYTCDAGLNVFSVKQIR